MAIDSSALIHPTAIVAEGAVVGARTEVGPYSIIGSSVAIGADNKIGPHVVIEGRTKIGEGNTIYQFSSLGAAPQDLKYRGELSSVIIGDRNTIREYVTIQRGTQQGGMSTIVGDDNLFMVSSHVAHDVRLGSKNVIANGAAIAGHVEVGDRVTVGGLVGIHQFVRVGDLAILSGGAMVTQDVPPFCMVQGDRARLIGLNSVGLERAGVSKETTKVLRRLFRELFGRQGLLADRIERLELELAESADPDSLGRSMLDFLKSSSRGVCALRRGADDNQP